MEEQGIFNLPDNVGGKNDVSLVLGYGLLRIGFEILHSVFILNYVLEGPGQAEVKSGFRDLGAGSTETENDGAIALADFKGEAEVSYCGYENERDEYLEKAHSEA